MKRILSMILSFAVILTTFSCLGASVNATTESDAYFFEGHGYKLITTPLSFHDAQKYCESLGGHLLTITSKEENAFIVETFCPMATSSIRIGLSDEASEGTWKWVTGEPVEYTNWKSGEPNNMGNEDYVIINPSSGLWNDGHSNSTNRTHIFICEWESEMVLHKIISSDYLLYQSEKYSSFFDKAFVGTDSSSYARTYYNMLKSDKNMIKNWENWEKMHIATEPSHSLESGYISKKNYYQMVLFDMLNMGDQSVLAESAGDKYLEYLEAVNNEQLSFTLSIADEIADENGISTSAINSLPLEALKNNSKLISIVGTAEEVSSALSVCKDVSEAIKMFSDFATLNNINDGTKEVLLKIATNPNCDSDLKEAARECISCFNAGYQQTFTAIKNGTVVGAKALLGSLADKSWEYLVSFVPGGSAVLVGAKGIRALTNLLFSQDEVVEAYYALESIANVENALIDAMSTCKNKFLSLKSDLNALVYMRSIALYKNVVLLGMDYSIDLIQIVGSAKFNSLFPQFGNTEECNALAKDILSFKETKLLRFIDFEKITYEAFIKNSKPHYGEIADNLEVVLPNPSPNEAVMNFQYSEYCLSPDSYLNNQVFVYSETEQNVTYHSENTDIAIVSDYGEIVPISSGVVNIVATADNGQTAVCEITIPSYEFTTNYETGECSIYKYIGNEETVTIPDYINGLPVTNIFSYAFYECESVENIELPKELIEIGEFAFLGCTSLCTLDVPDKVQNINNHAFAGSSLETLYIPESVTYLGNFFVEDCDQLKTIYYAGTQSQWNDIFLEDIDLPYMPAGATVICKPDPCYNINFHDINGVSVLSFSVTEGSALTDEQLAEVGALVPEIFGYDFVGWDSDIAEPIYADTVFKAIYSRKTDKDFNLNVSHKGEDKAAAHSFDEFVTVTADSENFLCWKDAVSGTVMSLNPRYSFYIPGNISLVAVYKESESDRAELPIATINSVVNTVDGGDTYNAIFTAKVNLPEGATLLEKGLIFTNDTGYALGKDNFNLQLNPAIVMPSRLTTAGNFMMTLTEIGKGKARYARAYATYELNGETHTAYSDYIANVCVD